MSDWSPMQDVLLNVLEVLQDSFIPDNNIQKEVQERLTMLQCKSDIFNYFILVFEDSEHFDNKTRALAGLIIKNNLSYMLSITPSYVIQNIKSKCLKLLTDGNLDVRSSASSVINVIALKGGIENWPELVPHLLHLLGAPDYVVEIVIRTLINICEDYLSQRFNVSLNVEDSIKILLSKFVELTQSVNTNTRRHSFKILNESLLKFYDSIKNDFNTVLYLQKLFEAANDVNEEIIMLVCQGFSVYINNKDEAILPFLNDVINYILVKTNNNNEDIAMQACEFWFSMSKLPTCKQILRGYLKELVPMLIKHMRYSMYEINILQDTLGNDAHLEDKREDVKPFCRAMDDDEDPEIGWTLRKCSAACLDSLAVKFQEEMTEIAMPLIMDCLQSTESLIKECGILALGAIADGCLKSLSKHLPVLIPGLIHFMEDSRSLIRSITCWTLSRYVNFIVYNSDDSYFVPIMMVLLQHFLDDNKRVQRAAISSFCFLQEEAKSKLVPHLELISQVYYKGLDTYQERSLYLLYDAITVLAQAVGAEFKIIFKRLVLHMLEKFTTFDDYNNSEEFLAICECFSSVISAVEQEFIPYTEIVFNKCNAVLQETVKVNPSECEEFYKDIISSTLDLLVTIAYNINNHFVKFVMNSNLLDHVFSAIHDEADIVRQPGLALLGEIIRLCYPYIENNIHIYIPAVIENLDKRFDGACHNAALVIFKLCLAMEDSINPHVGQIIEHCVGVLETTDGLQDTFKTVSIALCTLGMFCPDEVAPSLKIFMRPVCSTIRNVCDGKKKEIAFRGLCELVIRNPEVFANDFIYFCDAVASWNEISFEFKDKISSLILDFKRHVGEENWNRVYGNFPELLKSRMNGLYGV